MRTEKVKAYSYLRMSTTKQLKGDSKRRQMELAKKYCKENNLDLDTGLNLHDIGISAFKGDNVKKGSLGHFLGLVKLKKIEKGSYLIVESIDRLSREPAYKAFQTFSAIIEAEITIVTLIDEKVYTKKSLESNTHELIGSISIMHRAHDESMTKSKRLIESWENKRQGLEKKPLTSRCPAWLKINEDKTGFDVIPERVAIIERIFKEAAKGKGGYSIAKNLTQDGVPTWNPRKKSGSYWQISYLQKILHNNRAILGEFQAFTNKDGKRVPSGEPITNYFPPIINKSLYNRVQKLRAGKLVKSGSKGKYFSNLFSGIAVCGYCGESIIFDNKGGHLTYLVCINGKLGKNCEYNSWRYNDFETSFLSFINEINVSEILNREGVDRDLAVYIEKKETLEFEISEIDNLLERYQKSFEEVQDSQTVPKKLIGRMHELEVKQEVIRQNVNELKNLIKTKKTEVKSMIEDKEKIAQLYEGMNILKGDELFEFRLALSQQIKQLISKIVIYPLCRKWKKNENKAVIQSRFMELVKRLIETGDLWNDQGLRTLDSEYFLRRSILNPDSKKGRSFEVHFRSGVFKWIQPDIKDPKKCIQVIETEAKSEEEQIQVAETWKEKYRTITDDDFNKIMLNVT